MRRNKILYELMIYNKYINFFIFRRLGRRQSGGLAPSRLHFGIHLDWGLGQIPHPNIKLYSLKIIYKKNKNLIKI